MVKTKTKPRPKPKYNLNKALLPKIKHLHHLGYNATVIGAKIGCTAYQIATAIKEWELDK